MTQSGAGIYFDGKTSARHPVTVEIEPDALLVRDREGHRLARWPYQQLEELSSQDGVLRLGRIGSQNLERIEVRDTEFAAAIDGLAATVDRTGTTHRRGRRKVIFWSIAAVISLLLVGIYGIPEVASRLAPYVPYSVEARFGHVIDGQVRAMLDPGQKGRSFECGWAESESAGRAAFDRMMEKLEAAAGLPIKLKLVVLRRKEANAVALPGGHIYVFEGLITKAESADEVAGVIAHEIGHVAHRDGTRSVLQAGGLSFVFGLVLGDFVGGGVVIFAARSILQSAYSREVETAADLFAVELIEKAGGDGRALGKILTRIAGTAEPDVKILANHPATKERADWIDAATRRTPQGSLLQPTEWQAMRGICAGS